MYGVRWLVDTTIYCALNASRMPPNVGYFTFVAAVVMCVVDNADTDNHDR